MLLGDHDDHDARYEELRAEVRRLHRRAARLHGTGPTGDGRTGDEQTGDEQTGDEQTGDEQTGDEQTGDGRTGDDAAEVSLVRAVEELVVATDAMLAYGDRLPVLRDLPARALSVQAVRAAALAALLGAVLLGLGIWRDLLSGWWLPLMLAMVAVAASTATLTVAPAAGRHRRQRWTTGIAGAAALLFAPVDAVCGTAAGAVVAVVFVAAASVLFEARRRS